MNPAHGLPETTVARIAAVLDRFPQVERATLFGSRAKGNHRPGSDIDLALEGAGLDWRIVGQIDDALDDLLLPYEFSLVRHDASTDRDVAAHIARVGVPLFVREAGAASPR